MTGFERRSHILGIIDDMVLDFLVYDRKDDEDLPRGQIEAAIAAKEVSIEEMVSAFREGLTRQLPPKTPV